MDSERTRLYLMRHGEVVNPGVYNGQTDVDITPLGVKQMERLRELLKDKSLTAIYSSDLLRTKKGAEIIGQPHGLQTESFGELREMNFGRWQGLTYQEVMEKYPQDIPQWMNQLETFRIPEGESILDVRERAMRKLEWFLERHRGKEFAMVCHGALNRVIFGRGPSSPHSAAFADRTGLRLPEYH